MSTIFSNIKIYLIAKFYEKFVGLITAFIRPLLLSPDAFGLFTIIKVIPYYASYLNLGTYDMIRYRIPYLEVQNKEAKISEIRSTVFLGTLFLHIVVLLSVILITLFIRPNLVIIIGILFMVCLSFLNWYYDNLVITLKGRQKFFQLSKTLILKSSLALIINFLLIYFFNLYGLYIAMLISTLIGILYIKKYYHISFDRYFSKILFFNLLKAGFPIMIFNFSIVLITTSDRIIISYYLGTQKLGFYAIGIMITGFLIQIPASSREVMEPQLMQQGGEVSMKNMESFLLKPLVNVAIIVSLLIGGAIFLLPILVNFFLPKYHQSIFPGQILMLGSFFLSLTYVTRGIIIYNNWQKKACIITLATLLVNIFLNLFAIKAGFGLLGVASSSAITYFAMFVTLIIFIWRYEKESLKELKKTIIIISWLFTNLLFAFALCKLENLFTTTKYSSIAFNLGGVVLFNLILFIEFYLINKIKKELVPFEISLKKVITEGLKR